MESVLPAKIAVIVFGRRISQKINVFSPSRDDSLPPYIKLKKHPKKNKMINTTNFIELLLNKLIQFFIIVKVVSNFRL